MKKIGFRRKILLSQDNPLGMFALICLVITVISVIFTTEKDWDENWIVPITFGIATILFEIGRIIVKRS